LKLFLRIAQLVVLLGGFALFAQSRGESLPPSNLDPPPKSQPPAYHEPRPVKQVEPERKWAITDYVDPSDPMFYGKLALLLGSVLLARKAFRQMRQNH
jgi:hypothetical protein